MFFKKSAEMPTTETALPGRDVPMPVEFAHAIYNRDLRAPDPEGFERLYVGMGCFWGAERKFWQLDGVYLTAVGYQAGVTKNPTYKEVCTGMTGHNETVLIVFDPSKVSRATILKTFWESHDPTQGMRQGNDHGTQYRSGIYTTSEEQKAEAIASKEAFGAQLKEAGFGAITTEILSAPEFFYAEDYHQQYLHKNPGGYCGLGGTGVSCPIGLFSKGKKYSEDSTEE